MKDWIIARIKEPSTWAGLSALGLAIGLTIEQWSAVSSIGVAIGSALAVFLSEKTAA